MCIFIQNLLNYLLQEEPMTEEDLRALQKDRQKKDNHNMSKFFYFVG